MRLEGTSIEQRRGVERRGGEGKIQQDGAGMISEVTLGRIGGVGQEASGLDSDGCSS